MTTMDNSRKVLQSHNSMNSISSGVVNRIRAQLLQKSDPWNAKDKWRLESPIESGRVLRITREMAPKPDEPLELNHVPRWTRRQKFLFDTETGVLTPFDDDHDDQDSEKGEWMVFDEQGFASAGLDAALVAQSSAETGPTPLLVHADKAERVSAISRESRNGLAQVQTPKTGVIVDGDDNLGRRVSVLEAKDSLYRKVVVAALAVAAIALACYFLTRRLPSPRTS